MASSNTNNVPDEVLQELYLPVTDISSFDGNGKLTRHRLDLRVPILRDAGANRSFNQFDNLPFR
jgi:hypothetical protein